MRALDLVSLALVGALAASLVFWWNRSFGDEGSMDKVLLALGLGLLVAYPGLQLLIRAASRLIRSTSDAVLDSCFSMPLPELEHTSRCATIVRSSRSDEDKEYVFDEVFGVIEREVVEEWSRADRSREVRRPIKRSLPPVRTFAPR